MTTTSHHHTDEDYCDECGADLGGEHEHWCSEHGPSCPLCGRDYEGCECEDGIGRDSFR